MGNILSDVPIRIAQQMYNAGMPIADIRKNLGLVGGSGMLVVNAYVDDLEKNLKIGDEATAGNKEISAYNKLQDADVKAYNTEAPGIKQTAMNRLNSRGLGDSMMMGGAGTEEMVDVSDDLRTGLDNLNLDYANKRSTSGATTKSNISDINDYYYNLALNRKTAANS